MFKLSHNRDATSQAMELLAVFDGWLMARHQWIVRGMRSVVTGEPQPALDILPSLVNLLYDLDLPESLRQCFADESRRMEACWQEVVRAAHPLSALPLFQQLDQFQHHAENFMREAERASKSLWHEFALRDSLTGARTRLTLCAVLQEKKQECKRALPSCIVLLDQNAFKSVNDRWGHATGDQVLAMTAQLIQQQLRAGDVLFRYGGDEWLVVLAHTEFAGGEAIAARVRQQVQLHEFTASDGTLFHSELAYGVAEVASDETPEAWIARADQAMYAMKRAAVSLSGVADEG